MILLSIRKRNLGVYFLNYVLVVWARFQVSDTSRNCRGSTQYKLGYLKVLSEPFPSHVGYSFYRKEDGEGPFLQGEQSPAQYSRSECRNGSAIYSLGSCQEISLELGKLSWEEFQHYLGVESLLR